MVSEKVGDLRNSKEDPIYREYDGCEQTSYMR